MPTIGYVKVTIVQVYSMRHTEWPKKYFATVTINDVTEKTEEATLAVMSNAWNQELTFTISGSSKLKIQIFQQHRFHDDSLIGTCEGDLEDLLMQSLNGNIEQEFRSSVISQTKVSLAFRVEFHEDPAYQTAIMKAMIQRTKLGSLRLAQPRAQRLLSGSSQLVDEAVSPDLVEAWIPLLQKLEIFANLANMITEVHPYAKAAYSVISLAYKVVHDQIQRDMNIQCLVNTMDDIYSFVKEAEPLHHIESQRQVMACLAQQTVECGYFISAYCSETFLARAVRHSVNPTDLAVIEYGQKFSDLKAALLAHATIQTEIKVLRIFETAERIETKIDLGDIPYANGVRFRSSKRCLSGTRDSIVNKIIEWLDNPEPGNRRILMLKGSSGTGKSTIAHSIASHYHDLKRLGSSIFVNLPDDPKTVARLPALIFPTIARDLADLDPHFRNALWNIIESDKALRKALDPTDQYENFILGPSTTLTMSGPIVICFLRGLKKLPTNVRIFLTVQQDSPILGHSDQNTVEMIQVDNFDWSTKCDLLRFLNYKLLANLPVDQYKQFSNPMLLELVDLSHGSFQWIDWVSDALCSRSPRNLVARYQDIVDPLRQPQNPVPLAEDHLFLEEIQRLASLRGPSFLAEFRLLMGTLLTSYTPLSLMEFLRFADFLDDNNKHTNMRNPSIGHVFESLLMHSKSCYMPLVPHHPSFYDFLCDTSRSKEFCIDISSHHGSMALACLRVLNKQLQFNICHLPSSFCANADIPNLSDCIERNLTPELSYASRFWMKHIQSCAIYLHGGLQKLLVQLQKFF
ncbi:hypothetical protein BDP27DRAFT_1434122 [Rhodocollybia butyracea]|uniref:C2 domain-containing protein n=1 Tax=Rhodocollybia butyracea TaxID=206335 RepID=A0A9P5P5P1_9AGAR|nr:hypothetical protein BDP27DRAFT_1434122 [Rhodocollybia butyracea]